MWDKLGCGAAAVLITVGCLFGQARADARSTASRPDGPVRLAAASAFEAAHKAFQNGEYETALTHYRRAYALLPHPSTLYNLALTHERLLDYETAVQSFERFLAAPLAEEAALAQLQKTHRQLAERSLRRLRELPARISASAVPDKVQVAISPVLADGTLGPVISQLETPGIFTVASGRYRLLYTHEGYFPQQVDVDARIGQALLLSRHLQPKPRSLHIETFPPAKLFLDDRPLGTAPQFVSLASGIHRLRAERPFFLPHAHTFDLPQVGGPVRFAWKLVPSGRLDMIAGGGLAGAGIGLMVLRLFQGEIENIENMPVREIYKPLLAATLPAVVGAAVAGLAGWEMPTSQSQLLIGSAAWGTMLGFGVGLGAQPQWLLPHVLAVGGGLIGGTLGAVVWRWKKPASGSVAVWNSTVLWSTHLGALCWAFLLTRKPEATFFGRPPEGRTGEGGFAILGSTALGIGLGLGLSQFPHMAKLNRGQVAMVDLGGLTGGALFGLTGLGLGYAGTQDWVESARIAIPSAMAGIAAGLLTSALLVHRYMPNTAEPKTDEPKITLRAPTVGLWPTANGSMALSTTLLDGSF